MTTLCIDTHIVLTEFGLVGLEGKSLRERAKAWVEISHPQFRDEHGGGYPVSGDGVRTIAEWAVEGRPLGLLRQPIGAGP